MERSYTENELKTGTRETLNGENKIKNQIFICTLHSHKFEFQSQNKSLIILRFTHCL